MEPWVKELIDKIVADYRKSKEAELSNKLNTSLTSKQSDKKCYVCKKVLPLTDFSARQQNKKRGKCKKCEDICNRLKGGEVTKQERKWLRAHHFRARFNIPAYKKVYTVYQYKRNLYSKIFKRIQALAYKYDHKIFHRTSAYRVLDLCYKLDSKGKKQHLGDEKHIFRYNALENILNMIADCLLEKYQLLPREDVLLYLFKRTHIIFYKDLDENQAELFETIRKPIGIRLKANIMLLKCLNSGMEIEDAVVIALDSVKS